MNAHDEPFPPDDGAEFLNAEQLRKRLQFANLFFNLAGMDFEAIYQLNCRAFAVWEIAKDGCYLKRDQKIREARRLMDWVARLESLQDQVDCEIIEKRGDTGPMSSVVAENLAVVKEMCSTAVDNLEGSDRDG